MEHVFAASRDERRPVSGTLRSEEGERDARFVARTEGRCRRQRRVRAAEQAVASRGPSPRGSGPGEAVVRSLEEGALVRRGGRAQRPLEPHAARERGELAAYVEVALRPAGRRSREAVEERRPRHRRTRACRLLSVARLDERERLRRVRCLTSGPRAGFIEALGAEDHQGPLPDVVDAKLWTASFDGDRERRSRRRRARSRVPRRAAARRAETREPQEPRKKDGSSHRAKTWERRPHLSVGLLRMTRRGGPPGIFLVVAPARLLADG